MKKQITQEDLKQREREVRKNIRAKQQRLSQLGQDIIRPVDIGVNFSDNVAGTMNRMYSLYRGLKLGFSIVKMFGFFRKKKS
jgi:hypothetical protein